MDNDGSLLEKALKLSQENNEILNYLKRAERIKRGAFFVRWLIITGIAVGAYFALTPYLSELRKTYESMGMQIEGALKLFNQLPK